MALKCVVKDEQSTDGYMGDDEFSRDEQTQDEKTDNTQPTLQTPSMQLSLLIRPVPTNPPCPQIPMGPPPPIPSPPSPPIQPLFAHFAICHMNPPPFVYFPHPILLNVCVCSMYVYPSVDKRVNMEESTRMIYEGIYIITDFMC